MRAATSPERREKTRLLVHDPRGARVMPIGRIAENVCPGDVWVVNDAATFPASLSGLTEEGASVELRLLPNPEGSRDWPAVLFGGGSWRDRTEDRVAPPLLRVGSKIVFDSGLFATVAGASDRSPRLLDLQFSRAGIALWEEVYRLGRPIQYSYLKEPVDLGSVQTSFAGRPWASEMPSAGRPLRSRLLREIREKGGIVRFLTHATGLSSTGDSAIDASLPLPEASFIPEATVQAIKEARAQGRRVVAVGTSVLRALEDRAQSGLGSGVGVSRLRIDRNHRLLVADGILSGIHLPGESHFDLMESFETREDLLDSLELAEREGLVTHEFGDSMLLWRRKGPSGLR